MSWIKRLVAHCNVCGHEWMPKVDEPVQCANQACKSRLWNRKAK